MTKISDSKKPCTLYTLRTMLVMFFVDFMRLLRVCFEILFTNMNKKMFKIYFILQSKKPFLLAQGGRPALLGVDDAYDDILRVVRTGMQWRYLRPTAAAASMHKWIDAGLFHTTYECLLRLYRRHRRPRLSCVDSTFVKNVYGVDCVGRNPTDRGRMATKLSAAVDDEGVPYSLLCTPGNQSDMRLLQPTLAAAIVPTPTGKGRR